MSLYTKVGFPATVLREPKTRARWRLLRCGMHFICGDESECKSLCITLYHNGYKGEKLVSLLTDHKLS